MRYLLFITLLYSFSTFGRAPAVLPSYSSAPLDGKGKPTEYIYFEGKSVPLKSVSLKSKGQKITRYKITKQGTNSASLAPIFLMFFALSIPFLAWVFISDEESVKTTSSKIIFNDLEEGKAEVLEVDFSRKSKSTDEDIDEKIKKAS